MLNHLSIIFNGAIFVLAIIAGIGPQNLNIISHSIKRNHEMAVAITSFLGDIVFILIGCIGLAFSNSHILILIINIVGFIFMVWFLYTKIKGLLKKHLSIHIDGELLTKRQAILRAITLTWLNPLVFIDTIVIIGGASARYSGSEHIDFIIGAIIADFVWVFGITKIACTFSNKLNRGITWLILDITTILLMFYICYRTLLFLI